MMRTWLTIVLLWWGSGARAQWVLGVQGGPLFFQGVDPKANAQISNTDGWSAGVHLLEGRRGRSGFRIGLEAGERRYQLSGDNEVIRAQYDMRSTLVWISFEMRWALSRKHRIFFELGPVIGMELREVRNGHLLDWDRDGWNVYRVQIPDAGVETARTITDGHWRMGVSAELPLQGRLWAMVGAHVAPGIGNWSRGVGMIVVDSQVRAGIAYRLGRGRKW